jgi:hypothetical protein
MVENSGKPINLYALGSYFLEYRLKHGWLRKEGGGKNQR